MKNVIISMIAKISRMDADAKQLTAQVEAQSLLLSAMLLTLGKNGGMEEVVEGVKKAINTILEESDNLLKTDTELLLSQFNNLLALTQLLDNADTEIDVESLREQLPSSDPDKNIS